MICKLVHVPVSWFLPLCNGSDTGPHRFGQELSCAQEARSPVSQVFKAVSCCSLKRLSDCVDRKVRKREMFLNSNAVLSTKM